MWMRNITINNDILLISQSVQCDSDVEICCKKDIASDIDKVYNKSSCEITNLKKQSYEVKSQKTET